MTEREMGHELEKLGCTKEQVAQDCGNRNNLACRLAALKIKQGVRLIVDGGPGAATAHLKKTACVDKPKMEERRASIARARKERGEEEPKEEKRVKIQSKPSKYGVAELLREIAASEQENRRLGNGVYMAGTETIWRKGLKEKEAENTAQVEPKVAPKVHHTWGR
jgi:hypothetical protein